MSDLTQKTLEMLIQENDSLKKDLANVSEGMLKAMLALDARMDELESALVAIARRVPAPQPALRMGEAEVGKEL